MNIYISINSHVEIHPKDMLKSPMGNHYQVISFANAEILKLNPLDIYNESEADLEFCINKHSLINGGWKKRMI